MMISFVPNSNTGVKFVTLAIGGIDMCKFPFSLVYFSHHWILFQSAEVEETLKRIQSHKGVVGVIVVNSEGKVTLSNTAFCIITIFSVTARTVLGFKERKLVGKDWMLIFVIFGSNKWRRWFRRMNNITWTQPWKTSIEEPTVRQM